MGEFFNKNFQEQRKKRNCNFFFRRKKENDHLYKM